MLYSDRKRRIDIKKSVARIVVNFKIERKSLDLWGLWLPEVSKSKDYAQNAWNWRNSRTLIEIKKGLTCWKEKIAAKTFEKK